ncbi:MAG TPA: hypothetical protein VH857_06455 [Actinomycetes bacterium]|nr:hypothetical protein [Actinomycetes bacterium]
MLQTAGEVVEVDAAGSWATEVVRDLPPRAPAPHDGPPTVRVRDGWPEQLLASGRRMGRGMRAHGGAVALTSACSSGVDLDVRATDVVVSVLAARRPTIREATLHRVLPERARLLTADVLLHYPAIWRSGWRGRAPLHAGALVVGGLGVLVVGASGVGKSTLAMAEVGSGATFVSDNLVVSDGRSAWGLLEPVRAAGGDGARTTHGRRLVEVPARRLSAQVDLVVVLRREGSAVQAREIAPDVAARELTASTYAAGELRRYWGFAATLAAGTGRGPVHPPVASVAEQVCSGAPCLELDLGDRPGPHLSHVVETLGVTQWT